MRSSMILRMVILFMICADYIQIADCCAYGNNSDCRFLCRCNEGIDCNSTTGECNDGHCLPVLPYDEGYGWKDAGCRRGNIAYNKWTNQSGGYADHTSDRAVDGNTSPDLDAGSCAHPSTGQGGPPAWWQVDLGEKHIIEEIIIFNRNLYRDRTNKFFIKIGMTSDVNDHEACAYFAVDNPSDFENISITCDGEQPEGRYVSMQRENESKDQHAINICEFVVMGYKPMDCQNNCNSDCDTLTGCTTCYAGYALPDCLDECVSSSWGANCQNHCGACLGKDTCDRANGSCPNGCEQWHTQDSCDVTIELPSLDRVAIEVNIISSSEIQVRWHQWLGVKDGLDNHYLYRVKYGPTGSDEVSSEEVWHDSNVTSASRTLIELLHNTKYEVKVVPFRVHRGVEESGQETETKCNTTLCKAPSRPSLEVSNLKDRWTIYAEELSDIETGCDEIVSYMLYVTSADNESMLFSSSVLEESVFIFPYNISYNGSFAWTVIINNQHIEAKSSNERLTYSEIVEDGNTPDDPPSNLALVVGSCIGVIAVFIILILVFVIKRRQAIKTKQPNNDQIHDAPSLRTESLNAPIISGAENIYANLEDVDSKTIPVAMIAGYIQQKQKEVDGFKNEFLTITDGCIHSATKASEGANLGKNRFKNIKAYDDSRVVLDIKHDDQSSDYINASFIPGYNGNDKYYIAGQGPLPHTVADTWRMIWQYNVTRVVMVTNEKELGKQKCERYWPNSVGELCEYGDMLITFIDEERFADFTIRAIKCTHMGTSRQVTQFHFTSWPDKQALDIALPLLQFRHKVKSYNESGPLFVHCSAGVGRTGTYIAIDYLIEQGLAENKVDVHQCVTQLRNYRIHMVQTLAQYESIYKALYEVFTFGDPIPCGELDTRVDCLKQEIAEQHQNITKWIDSVLPDPGDLDGLRPENISKNRDNSIIPADFDRPYLNTLHENGNDYVNAVYINSYRRALAYIVTQFPLPSTVIDFWRLVYDHKCGVIVTLGDIDKDLKYDNTKTTYYNLDDVSSTSFWPDTKDKKEEYGPIEVTLRYKDTHGMTMRNMEVQGSGVNDCQPITQVEFSDWPEGDLPQIDRLLELIKQIEKLIDEKEGPLLIQCFSGADKSGLMVAALYMTEYMKQEQHVDVVNVVRSVKKYRNQFLNNPNQYEFLYKVAQSYNQLFPTYANIM